MAREFQISRDQEWHRFEKKRFKVPCTEETPPGSGIFVNIDLTGVQLEWILTPAHSITFAAAPTGKKLNRTAAQFLAPEVGAGGVVPNVAVWEVSDAESGALYQQGAGTWYYHWLWDRSNDAILVYGGAILLPGQAVVVP